MIVDTHCHLDFEQFDEDRRAVVQRAQAASVEAMVVIGIDEEHWRSTAALANEYSFMVRAAGFHPNSLGTTWSSDRLAGLEHELEKQHIVAVGEIGLDYYRDATNSDLQREAFKLQLDLARQRNLPIIIHQRAAEEEVLEILEEYAPINGVMHSFGGNDQFARQCLDLNLYLGIGGISTFKKSDDVREAIQNIPMDRIILETDAPFLAPQRWRGKRNEPAYIAEVARQLAEVKDYPLDVVEDTTTSNAIALFGSRLEAAAQIGARMVSS